MSGLRVEIPITVRKSAIIGVTKYEWGGAALTALPVANHRGRMTGMGTVRIPLHSRKYPNLYATIDEEDYELVSQHRWRPDVRRRRVYATSSAGFMHRVILGLTDPRAMVDHIRPDGLDNRRENLRVVTALENARNSLPHLGASSAFKGVTYLARKDLWGASIRVGGKGVLIGWFNSEKDAALAYDAYAREEFGEFAYLNFPNERRTIQEVSARRLRGEVDRTMKLTPDQAEEVRALCSSGRSQREVARMFGVSQSLVSLIVRRKVWQ